MLTVKPLFKGILKFIWAFLQCQYSIIQGIIINLFHKFIIGRSKLFFLQLNDIKGCWRYLLSHLPLIHFKWRRFSEVIKAVEGWYFIIF